MKSVKNQVFRYKVFNQVRDQVEFKVRRQVADQVQYRVHVVDQVLDHVIDRMNITYILVA